MSVRVSVFSQFMKLLSRPHLSVIAAIGIIVPRRLRADWREEWEAELRNRERLLADWDRLDGWHRRDLLRRSLSAFWDALWLQRQRREDDMVQDLRFAFRMLMKHPVFTCVAVFTLALGIGANTAVFTLVNALLLRPLGGVAEPERLVQVGRQYADKRYMSDSSYPDYLDYRAQSTLTSGLAVVSPTAFHLTTRGETERVEGELVSGEYFDVLGVTARQGRLISSADDREGADPVAVVSSRLWERHFGGAADVIGTGIKVDGRVFTLIGVTSDSFIGTKVGTPRDVWIPIATLRWTDPNRAGLFERRHASWLEMFGRLKPGVALDQARTEFSTIAARLEREYPATNAHASARVEPGLGRDVEVRDDLRRFAYLPFAAVGIVLLIACANVAGLLLARADSRQKEIATRLALGAARVRIIRQLLTESAALALAGGAAGLAVGGWLTTWLRSLLPERYLFLSFDLDFGFDWRVFGFALAVAMTTAVLFGLAPALHVSRPALVPVLKGTRASRRRFGTGVRGAMIVAEVALSLTLLVAAGLCVRTLMNAIAIDTGYQTTDVLTARIDLKKQNYSEARGVLFQQTLVERIEAQPGVLAAGFAVTLPLNDGRWEDGIRRAGDPTRVQTFQNVVSRRYFDAMNIPVLGGRGFSTQDNQHAPKVAILNQTLARILWPTGSPLGERLMFKGDTIEVVGVVRDIKGRNLFEPPGPMMYLPLLQNYQHTTVLHLRTAVPPAQLISVLRREVQALDADVPLYGITTLAEHVTATLTPQRLLAYLITGFGALALVLSAIGLYALLAHTVAERTQEIGIRMALGAHRRDVMRLFVTRGMQLALLGIGLGLAVAWGVTRWMNHVLFNVSPHDPLTLVLSAVVLVLATLAACYIPASRAARADPTSALRYE